MLAGVVKSSLLATEGRWDVGHYLGGLKGREEILVKANRAIMRALAAHRLALRSVRDATARQRDLIASGQLVLFKEQSMDAMLERGIAIAQHDREELDRRIEEFDRHIKENEERLAKMREGIAELERFLKEYKEIR